MKVKTILFLCIICCAAHGQTSAIKLNNNKNIQQQDRLLRKQVILSELENQIKDIPLTAVRVFARYRIATWLWQNGRDEMGQAESIAVKALSEAYERRTEIPVAYFNSLRADIFTLLETNARESAKRLRAKYDLASEDELNEAYSLLHTKNGEKPAADKLQQSLANKTELSSMTIWLMQELAERKSPELLRILSEILALEETGRSNFSAETLFFTVAFFRNSFVSNELRSRFYNVLCNKARNAIQQPDSDAKSVYDLLNAVLPDIAENAPALLPEASMLQYVFKSRVPLIEIEASEAYQKIEASQDRLNTLISEAEASRDKGLRTNLLVQAAQLASQEGNFNLAIELLDKIKANSNEATGSRFTLRYDQFLSEIAQKALAKGDAEAARHAAERVVNKLTLANILCRMAIYHHEKRDFVSVTTELDQALKIAVNTENNLPKIYLLVHLLSTAQRIYRVQIPKITEEVAKATNDLPRLSEDNKPETDNSKRYVNSILAINERLTRVFEQLLKQDRNLWHSPHALISEK